MFVSVVYSEPVLQESTDYGRPHDLDGREYSGVWTTADSHHILLKSQNFSHQVHVPDRQTILQLIRSMCHVQIR